MLKLSITLRETSEPWHYHGGQWQSEENWIKPLAHPLIEHRAFTDGASVCIVVREHHVGQAPTPQQTTPNMLAAHTYREMVTECHVWPLDALTIEIATNGITLQAGPAPVAPIYFTIQGHTLSASWDLSDLRPFMRPDALVDREVARQLSGYSRYGHETLFEGVYQLTAGSTAIFGREGLQLAYPVPVAQPLPRWPAQAADLVAGFDRLLHDVLSLHPIDPGRTTIQLSGGQDSATVALSLGAMFPNRITSCAMILPGPVGEQQVRRRAILASAAHLTTDVQIPALEYAPLLSNGLRVSRWCSPTDEPYIELLTALIEAVGTHGIHTIVTGFGGDELMMPDTSHRTAVQPCTWLSERVHDWLPSCNEGISPATAVPETALMALAAVAPTMLRAGMWPIAPLVGKSLTWFANCLPHEWRAGKHLMRQHLIRLGLPREVAYPMLRENFTAVMGHGLHHYGVSLLRRFADDSHLVRGGYIDPTELRRVANRAAHSIEAATEQRAVFAVLAVELSLQQLI